MSASQRKLWTRRVKRGIVPGRTGGGKERSSFRGEAAYLRRLRRLESVVLVLTMKRKLPQKVLDSMLDDMLLLEEVVEPKPGSGSANAGDPLSLSHSGPADGQAEGDSDA